MIHSCSSEKCGHVEIPITEYAGQFPEALVPTNHTATTIAKKWKYCSIPPRKPANSAIANPPPTSALVIRSEDPTFRDTNNHYSLLEVEEILNHRACLMVEKILLLALIYLGELPSSLGFVLQSSLLLQSMDQ